MDTQPDRDKAPGRVPRGLLAAAAAMLLLLGVATAGKAVFDGGPSFRFGAPDPVPATNDAAAAAADAPPIDGAGTVADDTRDDARTEEGSTELRLARGIAKFAVGTAANTAAVAAANTDSGGSTNANASATGGTNAIDEVSAAAQQTAQSAELQGAVKSVWRLAWEKSWPFIKNTTLKFWDLMKQAWHALATVGRSSQEGGANANVNAAANANEAAGANASP